MTRIFEIIPHVNQNKTTLRVKNYDMTTFITKQNVANFTWQHLEDDVAPAYHCSLNNTNIMLINDLFTINANPKRVIVTLQGIVTKVTFDKDCSLDQHDYRLLIKEQCFYLLDENCSSDKEVLFFYNPKMVKETLREQDIFDDCLFNVFTDARYVPSTNTLHVQNADPVIFHSHKYNEDYINLCKGTGVYCTEEYDSIST